MQYRIVFTLASVLALVAATKLPAELPDGIYVDSVDAGGIETWIPWNGTIPVDTEEPTLLPTIKGRVAPSAERAKRALPPSSMGCTNRKYATSQKNTAVTQLKGYCDSGNTVKPHGKVVFKVGTAMAYMCNYSPNWQGCGKLEAADADAIMDSFCGTQGGTWLYIYSWLKTFGRDASDASICDNL